MLSVRRKKIPLSFPKDQTREEQTRAMKKSVRAEHVLQGSCMRKRRAREREEEKREKRET